MMAPRWRKVLADLWTNKVRTVLTVLSIAVGVLAVGTIATSNVILNRDMDASFRAINPAGAIMFTSPFDSDFLSVLSRLPGVGQVEGRTRMTGFKLRTGDAQDHDLELRTSLDYTNIQLDHLTLVAGHWPAAHELLIERNGLRRVPLQMGQAVQVALPDGKLRSLKVAGVVEDRTTDTTGTVVYGYISMDTLESLGYAHFLNFLEFSAADHAEDREHVRAVGRTIEEQFRRMGGQVYTTIVRDPGRHPNSQQVSAVTALLAALAVLTIFLSGFLVINTVSALMTQQIRVIGIMKATGGGTGQIMGMYLTLLLCLGGMAFVIAAPLGLLGGHSATQQIANALNFSIGPLRLEPLPLVLMAVLSLAVPVLAGMAPVLGGVRTTIRAAISGYGLGAALGRSLVDRLFARIRGISRPLLISLRNTARRKARLIMTLATLTLAGSIFMGVFSTQSSMTASLDRMYSYYTGDVNADIDRNMRVEQMAGLAAGIDGVARVEGWIFAAGEVLPPGPAAGKVAIDRMTISAPPQDSQIVSRGVAAGRWLLPEDQNALVVCTTAMRSHPEWHVGSQIKLRLNSRTEADFVIVGTFAFASGEGNKMAMASYDYLSELLNQRGRASSYRIITAPNDRATQDAVRDALSARLKQQGIRSVVTSGHTQADALGSVLNIIIVFLLSLALLIGLVGGLGLMGMMSMNVMERTREIGVMRSIGATSWAIIQLVVVEGGLIGMFSWVAAALLGIPIGQLLSTILGMGLFGTPFNFVIAWNGLITWLAIVAVLSILASALPAWNAARLTVREVLAYE